MAVRNATSDDSENLATKFQELQGRVNDWKAKLAHTLSKLDVRDDGSSSYRLLLKDLRDLRDHLIA